MNKASFDTIKAAVEARLVNEQGQLMVRGVYVLPGPVNDGLLEWMINESPALFILWAGAPRDMDSNALRLVSHWVLYAVVTHTSREARLYGDGQSWGLSDLATNCAKSLQGLKVPGHSALRVQGINNMWSLDMEKSRANVYSITATGVLSLANSSDHLPEFNQLNVEYDLQPADGLLEATDEVSFEES